LVVVSLEAGCEHCCRDAYADGPGVLLELVQNADDAGATEVAFMLDGRSYPADSVLGEQMSEQLVVRATAAWIFPPTQEL
jgi:hypothetical protein